MEEYAIASLKANRNLLRKRTFRNAKKLVYKRGKVSKKKVILSQKEQKLKAEKLARISQETKIRTLLIYGFIYFVLFCFTVRVVFKMLS